MNFSWSNTAKPIIASAPMDGYSDSAFRQIIKYLAPEVITFTEFISADGLSIAPKKLNPLLYFDQKEQPVIAQLFGKNPEHFAKGAEIIEKAGFAGVDINFGCPAKKVIGSGHGSDLIRNPQLAFEIVRQTVVTTKLDVSVKTRLGWEDSSTLLKFVEGLIKNGARAITIHGRTVKQKFSGQSDWTSIYEVKKSFPETIIIGNGDIINTEDAKTKIKNLDGLMIGRGSFGNPFLFAQITSDLLDHKNPKRSLKEIILKHAQFLIDSKNEKRAMLEFRKHLLFYAKGFAGAKNLRQKMTSIESLNDVKKIADEIEKLKQDT